MKYIIAFAYVTFHLGSCEKGIRYRNKGETITAATFHNNIDTGKVWIVDSIRFSTYLTWNPNYYGNGIGGWQNRVQETYSPANQFFRFKPDLSYSVTDSVSMLLGILSTGIYSINYLINAGFTHPDDSSTVSVYFSCSYCDPPALASRRKQDNLEMKDKLYIESSFYEPNPYDGQYFGKAFIKPLK